MLLLLEKLYYTLLLVIPLIIVSRKRSFVNLIYDFIPAFILELFSGKQQSKVELNSNYYGKSTYYVKANILTAFNILSEVEKDILWKKYLTEVNQSSSNFSYVFKGKEQNFVSGHFMRSVFSVYNSIVIADYNEKDVTNIIILEPAKNGNFTKICFYTLLNNAYSILFFK